MADLTSKEWRDLIFEGKNKEFGAYDLRKKSEKRHTLAMIFTLICLGIIILGVATWDSVSNFFSPAEELVDEKEEMDDGSMAVEMEEEDDLEDVPDLELEIPDEPIVEEQVLETIMDTQLTIQKADEVLNPPKDNDTMEETNTARGLVNQEGGSDADALKAATQQVVVQPEAPKVEKPKPEQVFTVVEQPAEFPGGQAALNKWLSSNLRFPQSAIDNGVSGKVTVRFVVEKDGSVSNVTVLKGVDKDLDAEAIRVVKRMPKWQPGKNNGHAVRSYFTLPVNFRLQN